MALPKKVSFADVCSKQKIKMTTQNTMASSYHCKVRFTQNMGVPLISLVSLISHGA